LGIRYVFTGTVTEHEGNVYAVFTKAAFWSVFHEALQAAGVLRPQVVHQSEKICADSVRAILEGGSLHCDPRDLDSYRAAWHEIRRRKLSSGIAFETDSIG
jgi:hypothetical protein